MDDCTSIELCKQPRKCTLVIGSMSKAHIYQTTSARIQIFPGTQRGPIVVMERTALANRLAREGGAVFVEDFVDELPDAEVLSQEGSSRRSTRACITAERLPHLSSESFVFDRHDPRR